MMSRLLLDPARLTTPVRRLLGRSDVVIGDWTATPLTAGWGTSEQGGGVVRVQGMAIDRDAVVPWSLVLKSLPLPADTACEGPAHFAYRQREALLYRSGLLDDLPGGLTAPACYGIDDSDDAIDIWLEDVADAEGRRWPLDRYALAARHLGAFNGAYLVARPIPDAPWLARDWLRQEITTQEKLFEELATADLAPDVRLEWPDDLRRAALRLWARRGDLLALLDGLPRVFCHRDAFRRNLLARRTPAGLDETFAIDWAFAGPGGLGEDLASLVVASVILYEAPWERLAELERRAFAGYLAGLAEAGWRGSSDLVLLGYRATAALRYGLFLGSLDPPSPDTVARTEQAWGVPYTELGEHMAAVRRWVLALGEEALRYGAE